MSEPINLPQPTAHYDWHSWAAAVTVALQDWTSRNGPTDFTLLPNHANDAAAAAGGVRIGSLYRNGSVVMVRVA